MLNVLQHFLIISRILTGIFSAANSSSKFGWYPAKPNFLRRIFGGEYNFGGYGEFLAAWGLPIVVMWHAGISAHWFGSTHSFPSSTVARNKLLRQWPGCLIGDFSRLSSIRLQLRLTRIGSLRRGRSLVDLLPSLHSNRLTILHGVGLRQLDSSFTAHELLPIRWYLSMIFRDAVYMHYQRFGLWWPLNNIIYVKKSSVYGWKSESMPIHVTRLFLLNGDEFWCNFLDMVK